MQTQLQWEEENEWDTRTRWKRQRIHRRTHRRTGKHTNRRRLSRRDHHRSERGALQRLRPSRPGRRGTSPRISTSGRASRCRHLARPCSRWSGSDPHPTSGGRIRARFDQEREWCTECKRMERKGQTFPQIRRGGGHAGNRCLVGTGGTLGRNRDQLCRAALQFAPRATQVQGPHHCCWVSGGSGRWIQCADRRGVLCRGVRAATVQGKGRVRGSQHVEHYHRHGVAQCGACSGALSNRTGQRTGIQASGVRTGTAGGIATLHAPGRSCRGHIFCVFAGIQVVCRLIRGARREGRPAHVSSCHRGVLHGRDRPVVSASAVRWVHQRERRPGRFQRNGGLHVVPAAPDCFGQDRRDLCVQVQWIGGRNLRPIAFPWCGGGLFVRLVGLVWYVGWHARFCIV
mmetsp:Transcript_4353/g.27689  ORF Transcript_4353/g.27689 Transcript_4353/m.27689 type:complete len:400 (+) Transcript_4353:98-1297(+)